MHVFYRYLYLHLGLCLRPLLSKSVKKFINTKQVIKNGEKTVKLNIDIEFALYIHIHLNLLNLLCMHSSCINLLFALFADLNQQEGLF